MITEKENLIHEITIIYKCVYGDKIENEVFKSKESSWINFKWLDINELDNYDIHPNNIRKMLNGSNHIVEKLNF